jgi:phage-related protein
MYHIYSIESHLVPDTYTGITRDLDQTEHYHSECSEDGGLYLYEFIRSHGGWKNFFIRHVSLHDTLEDARENKVVGTLNIYYQSPKHVPTIYRIFCLDSTIPDQYIGQTMNFDNRRESHFLSSINYENETKLYVFIRSHGGWKNWKMFIVKQYPTNITKRELTRLEWYWWTKLGGSLNSVRPGYSSRNNWKETDEAFEESVSLGLILEKFSLKEIRLDI